MEKQGYHYSQKTLKMANRKTGDRQTALATVIEYMETNFRGIEIPRNCIVRAFDYCFNGAVDQDMLNSDVKRYLIENLSRM